MSHRSTINTIDNKGQFVSIYCHNNGYPSYNGKILLDNYNTQDKVNELLSYGYISTLDIKLSPYKEQEHTLINRQKDTCLFYHRDRGDSWKEVATQAYKSEDEIELEEYNYLFKNGMWYWKKEKDEYWKQLTIDDILADMK